ncbi:helix-turn-helix transcriptional regulator [Microbacterium aureliae]
MDAMGTWLTVAADVLAEPDPAEATAMLTRQLVATTHAGLVSRITLDAADPDRIDISVSGVMYHPGPELWPTAAQVRRHPIARYRTQMRDDSPVLMTQVMDAGWKLDPGSEELMRDLRLTDQQLSIPVCCGGEYDGWVLIAEDRFAHGEADEARTIQRLLVGLDGHIRVLARLCASAPVTAAPALTPRESVILALTAEGCTAEAMARRLGISPRTVHKHQEHLYRKLGACDRLTAVLEAQQRGLLGLDRPSAATPPPRTPRDAP